MPTRAELGQFFTVNQRVQQLMIDLIQHPKDARILEPSAGSGELMVALKNAGYTNVSGWEYDQSIPQKEPLDITYGDFFDLSQSIGSKGYEVVFGNPPYVAWKNVLPDTRQLAQGVKQQGFSDKTNLYQLFLHKSIDLLPFGGEMIMIVPKEWTYSTSAEPLRAKMLANGHITHFIDGLEDKVFPDADLSSVMIFHYLKGLPYNDKFYNAEVQYQRGFLDDDAHFETKKLLAVDGRWFFLSPESYDIVSQWNGSVLGDHYSVKVGMVTGRDHAFRIPTYDPEILDEYQQEGTARSLLTTKGIEHYIDVNDYDAFEDIPENTQSWLSMFRDTLITRGIAHFDEGNWWKWGAIRNRQAMESDVPRIYTFAKTRREQPFFLQDLDEARYFGGGILGLFSRETLPVDESLEFLNSRVFKELCYSAGLLTNNKVSFQPSSLESLPFPATYEQLREMLEKNRGESD